MYVCQCLCVCERKNVYFFCSRVNIQQTLFHYNQLLKLFIRAAFVDNMVFTFFFGMCSYLAVSKTVKTAFGLGLAVIFVLVVTVPVNYLLENYILKDGALAWLGEEYADVDLSFLSFIM